MLVDQVQLELLLTTKLHVTLLALVTVCNSGVFRQMCLSAEPLLAFFTLPRFHSSVGEIRVSFQVGLSAKVLLTVFTVVQLNYSLVDMSHVSLQVVFLAKLLLTFFTFESLLALVD